MIDLPTPLEESNQHKFPKSSIQHSGQTNKCRGGNEWLSGWKKYAQGLKKYVPESKKCVALWGSLLFL